LAVCLVNPAAVECEKLRFVAARVCDAVVRGRRERMCFV
jgi:hypothetical protein